MLKYSLSHISYETIASYIPTISLCTSIMIAAIILKKLSHHAIAKMGVRNKINSELIAFIQRVTKYFIYAMAATLILENLNIHIGPLLATLGVTGIGVSFAMKDIVSNMMAGILILLYQPFKIGNTITAGSHYGKVIKVDLRFTTLQSENKKILIPNTIIYTNIVTIDE